MKKIMIVLARLIGVFFIGAAVAVLFFDKELWMMILCAAVGSFVLLASFVWPDEERSDNRAVATIINPMTMTPDFDGYRPGESDIPQQQPTAELYMREESGELSGDSFADLTIENHGE